MDELCAAATRLINRHLDFDALMSELQNAESPLNVKSSIFAETPDISPNVEVIHESLKLQASLSEMSIDVAANQMILKKLSAISGKHVAILADENLSNSISAAKRVSSTLNIQELMQHKDNFQHCLPMNILLELQENGILDMKDYLIMNVSNKSVLKEFVLSLQQLTRQNNSKVINKTSLNSADVAAGILTQLIRCAYNNTPSSSKALKKMCAYILFNIVKSHLQYLSTLSASKQILSDKPSIVSIIRSNLQNEADVLQKCFTQMISLWVTDSPNLKVSHAISTQNTWIASRQNEQLTAFYTEMSTCLGLEKSVSILSDILERREVNWKNLLTFISAMLVSFSESPKRLNSLISEKLKNGMETFSIELLAIAFLLARQLSLEGSHAFTTYANWFQENFGLNSWLISSNRGFRFFIKFLTDIIPYEPVRYLKAHVVKPPHPPSSCIENLKEYASLARVRIFELGGSLSEATEESEQTAEVLKAVKRVVDEYQNSNKIPRSLMEASIFQKSYFCKKFLPALMKPRPLPSIPDANMKLIEDLLKAQKIPKNVYATYKQACEKENSKLLQEVMVLDDDSEFEFEEEEISSRQQFVNALEVVGMKINAGSRNEGNNHECLLTEILTKLNRILHSIQTEKSSSDEEINLLQDNKKHEVLIKMTEDFLDWLGSFQDKISSSRNMAEDLSIVLKMTIEHHHFTSEICHLIWKFCTAEIAIASDLQLQGISLYLAIIGRSFQVKIPLLPYSKNEILKSKVFLKTIENWQTFATGGFSNAVVFSLDCYKDKETLIAALKFVCFTIETLLSIKQEVTSHLLNLFLYLGKRIRKAFIVTKDCEHQDRGPPTKFAKTDDQEIRTFMELHQKLLLSLQSQNAKDFELNAHQFLRHEIAIQTKKDILNSTERTQLYNEVFFANILNENCLSLLVCVILNELLSSDNMQTNKNEEVLEYFFKSFPLVMENCETIKSTGEFVLGLIQDRTGCVSKTEGVSDISKDIRWQNEVTAMSKFLLRLPPTFLFQTSNVTLDDVESIWNDNEKDSKMAEKNLQFVAQLINEYFFNMVTSSPQLFSLPHDLNTYLLRGLIMVCSIEEFFRFSVIICPCLMVSLIIHWRNDHGFKVFVKLRNQKLHRIITTICESFGEKLSLQQGYDILNSNLEGNLENSVSICLACIYLDLEQNISHSVNSRDVMSQMKGLSIKVIGFIAFFAILKMANFDETTSSTKSFLKSVLDSCFNVLNCEYVCNTLLRGKLVDDCKMLMKRRNDGGFSLYALRSQLQITVPTQLMKSRLFLPSLLNLEDESDRYLSRKETLILTDTEPDLRKLESLAVKHAPDSAILNSLNYLKKHSSSSPIVHLLHCETVKRGIFSKP